MAERTTSPGGAVAGFEESISADDRRKIQGLLEQWIGPEEAGSCRVSSLAGGAVNRVFLVEDGDRKLVLRIASPPDLARRLGVDMAASSEVAKLAGDNGLGPRVLGIEHPPGNSLIEFVPGVMNVRTLGTSGGLAAVGATIRKLHALPAEGIREVSAFDEIDEWLGWARDQDALPGDQFRQLEPRLEQCREILENVEGRAVSHRDVNPQNCMMTDEGVRLIDWDFAGVDSPYLDMAMLITYAELDQDQSEEYIEAIAGELHPVDLCRVQLMRFAHSAREWAWTLTTPQILRGATNANLDVLPEEAAGAEDFYDGYREMNLRSALKRAQDPSFDDWVTKADSDLPAPGFR